MKTIRVGIAVALPMAVALVWADPGVCGWQTWRVGQGLMDNSVRAMFQDRTGALWFGGPLGVSRYDGASWRTFSTADGFADQVQSIIEDRNGALWFAGPGGVRRYDGSGWRTFTTADGLADNYVLSMLEDRHGALWFGTYLGGVTRWDGVSWRTFTTADGLGSNNVSCMLEDRNGRLWFGSFGAGVSHFDGVNWRVLRATDGLVSNDVYSMLEDSTGAVWFASANNGVSRYDGTSWRTFRKTDGLASNGVEDMIKDRAGGVWFATYDSGASRYDGANWRTFTTADGLVSNSVTKLLEDQSGAIWFGSYNSGLSRYDGVSFHTFTTADGLVSNDVPSVLEDRSGALWFGSPNAGVSRYDGRTWQTFTSADGLLSDEVIPMIQDRNGALWFGGNAGASRYDSTGWHTFTYADGLPFGEVTAMLEDRNGALWFGTYDGGLGRYDGVSWHRFFASDGLASNGVSAILEDRNGVLWFGSYNAGVSRYDGTNWRTFTTADGLASNYVYSMLEDRSGALWFGTINAGVSRYDGASWRNFTAADGLGHEHVNSMLEDRSGALWFGTYGGGVSRYDGTSWHTFILDGGFAGNVVFSLAEDRTGTLWFGTSNGVTRHTPDRVPPQTVILSRPPALSANRIPSISYAPGFNESDVWFQYSLKNAPWSAWTPVGAFPANPLPDGIYPFEVRARDQYGNVESPPESLQFEIDATPPSPSILYPGPNAAIHDSVTIRGIAYDARFSYYRLETRPSGATSWTTIVDTVRSPVTNGVLGGWNTSGLPDGSYDLRLSVADALELVGTLVVPVNVDNHFPFSGQTSPALVTAATGGDVYTDDAEGHLYIPPHGLVRDTIVTVAALDTSAVPAVLPGGPTRVRPGFELGWGTILLAKTATLDISTGGASRVVVYFDAGDSDWKRIGGTFDPGTGRVTVPIEAPGRYALFLEDEVAGTPGTVRLSGITMTPRVFSPRGTHAASTVAIGFTLGRPGAVSIKVFNRAGRLVREVASRLELGAGANVVRWDGRDRNGNEVEAGAYLVSIETSGESQTRVLAVVP